MTIKSLLVYFLIPLVILEINFVTGISLPCSLKWKQVDANHPVETSWVQMNLTRDYDSMSEFIIRTKSPNSSTSGKTFSITTMQPFISKNTSFRASSVPSHRFFEKHVSSEGESNLILSYDILTNPYNCHLRWEYCKFSETRASSIQPSDYYVKVAKQQYVGRKLGQSNAYKQELDENLLLVVADEGQNSAFDICLMADLPGVANFSQFHFTPSEDNLPEDNVIGFDLIENDSGASITHVIDHKKRFGETFEFTKTQSWHYLKTWSFSLEVPINIPIPYTPITLGVTVSLGLEYTTFESTESEETQSFRKEREIISSRTITLEPYTSVQACSIMSLKNGLKLNYRAKGRHSALAGTKVEDMEKMLKDAGYNTENSKKESDSIIVDMDGDLAGTMALRTVFIVSDVTGDLTCEILMKKIEEKARLKSLISSGASNRQKLLAEMELVERQIARIKDGLLNNTPF